MLAMLVNSLSNLDCEAYISSIAGSIPRGTSFIELDPQLAMTNEVDKLLLQVQCEIKRLINHILEMDKLLNQARNHPSI